MTYIKATQAEVSAIPRCEHCKVYSTRMEYHKCDAGQHKSTLLKQIEAKETARLRALTYNEVAKEVSEWFDDEIEPSESAAELIGDYIEDYMHYRNDENEEELQKILSNK